MKLVTGPQDDTPDRDRDDADDHELLRRIAGGDREVFRTLVQRHQNRILALAVRFLGSKDAAEDVCQDALIRVFEHAGRITPTARFTTWLYRVVANLCWDARRRASRSRPALQIDSFAVEDASGETERAELQSAVREAVATLPDRQRMVLILHRFEGLGQAEIAEITGWSGSAVESCLVRAYASLREKLASDDIR
ncbi:MAG: sigma-70 family RNA polymerase sigma factor [Planctomycetes bacterium]|nr:sigma-70 family RNA polymerase sigma factor [Planctomycetota bacterium]